MTIHQRLQVFYSQSSFRFWPKHKLELGVLVAKKWREINPDQAPPLIESVEDHGTFQVFDYPREFVPEIDRLILHLPRLILERSRIKKLAAPAPPLKKPDPPTPPAPTKVRKRIPSKSSSKPPVWKGR